MLSMTKNHTDCPTCKCSADPTPIPANTLVDWETIEKAIEDWSTLLDEADLRKVWQLHKEKSRVQSLSIVHTKLRNSFIQISLKDLRIPVKHPNILGPKAKMFVKETSRKMGRSTSNISMITSRRKYLIILVKKKSLLKTIAIFQPSPKTLLVLPKTRS